MDELSTEFNFFLRHLGHEVIFMGNRLRTEVEKSMSTFEDNRNAKKYCFKLAKALVQVSQNAMKLIKDLKSNIKDPDLDPGYRQVFELLKNHIEKPFENLPKIDFKSELDKISQTSLHLDDNVKTEQLKDIENSKSSNSLDIVGYNSDNYEYNLIPSYDETFDKETTASSDGIPETSNNQIITNSNYDNVKVQNDVNLPDPKSVDVQCESDDDSAFSRETIYDNRNINEIEMDITQRHTNESTNSEQFFASIEKEVSLDCNREIESVKSDSMEESDNTTHKSDDDIVNGKLSYVDSTISKRIRKRLTSTPRKEIFALFKERLLKWRERKTQKEKRQLTSSSDEEKRYDTHKRKKRLKMSSAKEKSLSSDDDSSQVKPVKKKKYVRVLESESDETEELENKTYTSPDSSPVINPCRQKSPFKHDTDSEEQSNRKMAKIYEACNTDWSNKQLKNELSLNKEKTNEIANYGQPQLNDKDRDELLNMLIEKCSKPLNFKESQNITTIINDEQKEELSKVFINYLKTTNLEIEDSKICFEELFAEFEESLNKDTGSESESLLDVLREEIFEPEPTELTFNPLKQQALKAYKDLMEENDTMDLSSSSESSDGDELFKVFEREDKKLEQNLRVQFGINKDLTVDLVPLDMSKFNLEDYQVKFSNFQRKYDADEYLFNLSNIFKRISAKSSKKVRTKSKGFSLQSSSDDIGFSDDNHLDFSDDNQCENHSDDNEESDFTNEANLLLDDIMNSSDESLTSGSDSDSKKHEKLPKKKENKSEFEDELVEEKKNKEKNAELDSSDEEDFVGVKKVKKTRYDRLFNTLSSTTDESETDQKLKRKKIKKNAKKKPQKNNVLENSKLSSISLLSNSSDSDFEIIERTQNVILLSDDDDDDDCSSKKMKGRRNIRALVEDRDLAEATQKANNEERERIKRLQEREKVKESLSQSFSQSQTSMNEEEEFPLVLDVFKNTEIKVHPKITRKLKPHQRNGVQFMWDSCYESIEQLNSGYKGSGCILAHCMGLGKTLQALALIQALFANSEITKTKHVLVVCPLSTVANWKNEYNLAYSDIKHNCVKLYTIEDKKAASKRFSIASKWWKTGGVLILGYECFGLMINEDKLKKCENQGSCDSDSILKALVNPGPDLIFCDEGHLLRNKQSQRSLALNRLKSRRRIVLTGTPLQNNLLEYYYMVNFVKPNLLGTEREYKTNFVNPINNGQFEDSTAEDIMFMKKRTHVLHKILNRTVQRVEDTELKQYLPKLVDQAVFVNLSNLQVILYNAYLDILNSRPIVYTKTGNISHKNFLADIQILQYICSHPNVLKIAQANSRAKIKEQDVIDDNLEVVLDDRILTRKDWSKDILPNDEIEHSKAGTKVTIALKIIQEAIAIEDKVLLFANSLAEMENIEFFLKRDLSFEKDRDYYRMDGTVNPEIRTRLCEQFNNPVNKEIKVFILSTRVGGLGLNLTAANRVIIMNVNWNPSYDTQSVFRAFRLGQNKPVYVYRLVAIDTMEEKMYQKVVTKLAVAHRVVDKYQITRHYTAADIQEYYSVRPTIDKERPTPNVPEDRILAKLLQQYLQLYRWHEHQALLANRPEEDLNEQQKNAAWEEFNSRPSFDPVQITQPTTSVGNTSLKPPFTNQVNHSYLNYGINYNSIISFDHNYSLPQPQNKRYVPVNPNSEIALNPYHWFYRLQPFNKVYRSLLFNNRKSSDDFETPKMDRAKTDILHRTFPIVTPKVINKHGRGVSINTMPNSQTKTLQVIKPSKEVLGKETDEISHKKLIETFIKTTSPVTNTDSKHLNSTKENEKHRYSTTKQNSNFQERNKRKSKTMVIKTQKKQIDLCDIMQQQIQKAFKNIRNQNVPLSKKSVFLMEKLNDVTLQDGPSPTVAKEACKTVGHLRLVGNQIQPQYKELNDTMPRVNPPSVLAEEVRTMDQNPVKSQNTSPTVIRVKKFGIYDKMKNRRLSFRQDTPTYYRMKKLKDPELVNNQRSPLTNQVISSQKNPENDINIRPLCNNPLPNEIEASAIFKNDSKKRDILSSSVEQIVKNQVKKGPLLPSRIPISGRNKNVVVKQYTPIDLKKIEIRNRKAIQRLVNNQWRPFVSESNVKEIEVSPKIVAPNKTKVGSSKIVSPHFANRGVYSANIRMDATQTPRIPTNNIQANFKETQSYDEIPAVNKSVNRC
ncbi:hypothetical protein ABEB36_006965 [Hypothenemus hampei]|uniref:Transcriptional regulator ATRX n=1 Tax=Hypothenemus hampei TaxID=57062 RepID=A0ABD1ES96_HYPHA